LLGMPAKPEIELAQRRALERQTAPTRFTGEGRIDYA
jgi:hypothetical protein